MAIGGSNPYAPPSESADVGSTRRPHFDADVDVGAFVVELRGRLTAADLAVVLRITEDLQIRPALRRVLFWLLVVLLLPCVSEIVDGSRPVELGTLAVCVVFATALVDMIALRHVRYRILGKRRESRMREHVVRFDRHGLLLVPAEQLDAFASIDWPTLDVIALREGLVVTPRRGARVICFAPERELKDEKKQRVEALARALGGRVLARVHGEPL